MRTALIRGSDDLRDLDVMFRSPLCSAVKAGCASDILDLLLEAHADINGTDCDGLCALAVLGAKCPPRPPCTLMTPPHFDLLSKLGGGALRGFEELCIDQVALRMQEAAEQSHLKVASHLLARGADPAIRDFRGVLPSEHALSSKRRKLACLLQHYSDVQACGVLCQIFHQRGVRQDLVFNIGQYLVPKHVWGRFAPIVPVPRYAGRPLGGISPGPR